MPVECAVCVGVGAVGDGREAGRERRGEVGVEGGEGVDNGEQRATSAAQEAEGDDGDE